jgi:hypothetical protein
MHHLRGHPKALCVEVSKFLSFKTQYLEASVGSNIRSQDGSRGGYDKLTLTLSTLTLSGQ